MPQDDPDVRLLTLTFRQLRAVGRTVQLVNRSLTNTVTRCFVDL